MLRYPGGVIQLLVLTTLMSTAACNDSKEELVAYLTDDFSRLTAGSTEIIAEFQAILSSDISSQQKATELQDRVIGPYSKIVKRLETLEPQTYPIRTRHAEYTTLARDQLSAFIDARKMLSQGMSLSAVADRLKQIRISLERWQTAIKVDASSVGVPLNE